MTLIRQRGVAIVAALLVVALVTVLSVQWLARQNALGRAVEAQRNSTQARWLLIAATDWARVILREDRNPVDYIGEVWSVPLARTTVSDASGRLQAYVSGRIEDAQGRFNLADLVANNEVDPTALERFTRLCAAVSITAAQAQVIAKSIVAITPKSATPTPEHPIVVPSMPRLRAITELAATPQVSADILAALDPYVIVLARNTKEPTPINVNTASATVLASIAPQIAQGLAQAIVARRDQTRYFKDRNDFKNTYPALQATDKLDALITVDSSWFLATGRIEHGKIDMIRQVLIKRPSGQNLSNTAVVWSRDL